MRRLVLPIDLEQLYKGLGGGWMLGEPTAGTQINEAVAWKSPEFHVVTSNGDSLQLA
jgi:hypothetical protein